MMTLVGGVMPALEYADSISELAPKARDPLIHSAFLNMHSASLSLAGRYEHALQVARLEREVARTYGLRLVAPNADFELAVALLGLRQFQDCRASLSRAERAAESQELLLMNVGALHCRLHLALGFADDALRVLEHYEHGVAAQGTQAEYFAWWSLALAISRQGRDATALANRAVEISSRIEVSSLVPWTNAIVAVNSRRGGRRAAEKAFGIALETGNVDAFVTAYRSCPNLVELLARNPGNREELRTILIGARDQSIGKAVGLPLPPATGIRGPSALTPREREVLQLLGQGLTNKDIGRTLYIAEGTVKLHVRRVCKKLEVRTRTEAALRAAELSE